MKGLRTNRTLLVLNLSGNCIGDLGACKFAEVQPETNRKILKYLPK